MTSHQVTVFLSCKSCPFLLFLASNHLRKSLLFCWIWTQTRRLPWAQTRMQAGFLVGLGYYYYNVPFTPLPYWMENEYVKQKDGKLNWTRLPLPPPTCLSLQFENILMDLPMNTNVEGMWRKFHIASCLRLLCLRRLKLESKFDLKHEEHVEFTHSIWTDIPMEK